MRRRLLIIGAQITAVLGLVIGWQWAAQQDILDRFLVGTPRGVWTALLAWIADGSLWPNIGSTLTAFLVGYCFALLIGTGLGVLLATLPFLRQVMDPFVAFANSLPRLMFYPFFAIWLGFGLTPKALYVVFVVIVLVILNVVAGVTEIDRSLIMNMRVMGARSPDLIAQVFFPAIALWLSSAARLMVGYGFQAAIISEFIGSTRGLGHLVAQAQTQFDVNQVWAAIVVMIIIAIAMDGGLALVERRTTVWMAN